MAELLAIPSARRVLAGDSGLTISLLAITRLPIQPTVREGSLMLTDAMRSALRAIPGLSVLTEPDDLERYSRDATTTRRCCGSAGGLSGRCVVRPDSVDAVVQVAGLCHRHGAAHPAWFGHRQLRPVCPLEAGV